MPGKGKKPVSALEINQLAADLKARGQLIARLAKSLEKQQMQSIEVMGYPMAEKSVRFADTFIRNLKRELGEL